jgi:uncharacterized RDD family membrane protein YckC
MTTPALAPARPQAAAKLASDEILTGEGVALQVQVASVLARAGAWFIDALITGIVLIIAFVTGLAALDDYLDQALARVLLYGSLFVALLAAPATIEVLSHGRSLGKLAFGIQIIRDDGGPIRLRHSLVRALTGVFELWMTLGGVAFIVSMMNDRGKRVGDLLAGTYAANLRGATSRPLILVMPPELAGWADNADIRPLPEGLALRARQFLTRAYEFPPHVRVRLALRLAAQAEQYVAPSPPPGTSPELFLAAVLTERREREQAALNARLPRINAQMTGLEILPYSVQDPDN